MQRGANDVLTRPVEQPSLGESHGEERHQHRLRLEAFGRLTGGVVHDFNNLLTVISGYAQLIHRGLEPDSHLRAFVEEILQTAEHGSVLTRQLLAFGRAGSPAGVFDLNDVVRRSERVLRALLGRQVEWACDVAASPCPVAMDTGQLEQLLINLATNARDAMPRGGRFALRTAGDPGGATVTLEARDTGYGMDAATLARLFEPFFTTKPPSQGTGLGLTTVQRIVAQAGGRIEVSSAPGRGAAFTVTLPRAPEQPAAGAEEARAPAAAGWETVLLVEDDPGVRSLVRRTLALAGYRVLDADDGPVALALASVQPGGIDLLLAEAILPRMTGPEIGRRLRGACPDLAVLFLTADPGGGLVQQILAGENAPLLIKPFAAEDLLRRVREALDRQLSPDVQTG